MNCIFGVTAPKIGFVRVIVVNEGLIKKNLYIERLLRRETVLFAQRSAAFWVEKYRFLG